MLISNTIPEAGPDGDKLGPHFRRLEALSEPIQTRMETSAVTSADASNTISGDSELLGQAPSSQGQFHSSGDTSPDAIRNAHQCRQV